MFWFWFSVVFILALTILAMIWAVRLRRSRLERKLRLEIANQGNVDSHYQLRAEELSGMLAFRFEQNGARLPELVEPPTDTPPFVTQAQPMAGRPAAGGASVGQKAQKAMGISYILASLLTSIGSLLPGGAGTSVSRAGSNLYQGQAQASRVQQVGSQASSLAPSSRRAESASPSARPSATSIAEPVEGISWAETPAVQPGQTLVVDLFIRSVWIREDMVRSFQIKSRATEALGARTVVEDGQVEFRGGFWSHKIFPQLLIIVVALLALAMIVWAARTSGLLM